MHPILYIAIYLFTGVLVATWLSYGIGELGVVDYLIGIGIMMLWPFVLGFFLAELAIVRIRDRLRI